MKNDLSRRNFIRKSALLTSAAATMPMLQALAADTNAVDPNAAAAGAAPAAPPATPATVVLPPAPTPIPAPPGFGVAAGPFQPTWESLAASYQVPDWFRDAKFGIWAHWGPQCQPEMGDWYAQKMYQFSNNANSVYQFHCKKYGHPSKFGFKDVVNEWKAERWDPEHLISLYQRAGAKYFAAMANHHDNFDMFDSKYQPWNSVAYGPKKDIVGGWAKAVRSAGLRLSLTSHGDRAWSWYQAAQGSDPSGPLAGVPYDGRMTKVDGKGLWWEGLDPQDYYAQYHAPGRYGWTQSGNPPLAPAYIEKYFNRTIDLIDKYQPDLLYFDDTILPIYPSSDIGLRIAAYLYNTSLARNGKVEAVMTGKGLNAQQRRALVLDVERGVNDGGPPWQTDTCIGSWHYERSVFEQHKYKTSKQVSQMLIDIVSKNGNLQLSIPLPGHGVPDDDELKFLSELTAWMDVNSEGIYGTRPWKVYGEGPSTVSQSRGQFGGARDVRAYTAEDLRFTMKGDTLYAFVMVWPETKSTIVKSLAINAPQVDGRKVADVSLPGNVSAGASVPANRAPALAVLPELPSRVFLEQNGRRLEAAERQGARFTLGQVAVNLAGAPNGQEIHVACPSGTLSRVVLRWETTFPVDTLFLGDHWERGYGDLQWRFLQPERVLPWYFAAHHAASGRTFMAGVKTQPSALCFWVVDGSGISLWLDLRNGSSPSHPGDREITAATILSPMAALTRFCRLLCPKPRLAALPVCGNNNWYYAYGRDFDADAMRRDAAFLADISSDHKNRPFCVIDAGWTPGSVCPGGPWTAGDAKRFPDMPGLAADMKKLGVRPGIWFRPTALMTVTDRRLLRSGPVNAREKPLDLTLPENIALIRDDTNRLRSWGYELIKHDFSTYDIFGKWGFEMGAELTDGNWHFNDQSLTNAEIILRHYRTLREGAGDALLLGCNTLGHLGAGLFEIQRTGDDTSGRVWERTRRMGVNTLAYRLPQNTTFFACDSDCAAHTDQTPWEFDRQYLDLVARSGTPLFISVDPRTVQAEQKSAFRAAMQAALSGGELAGCEPLDWLNTTAPRHWRVGGKEITCHWEEASGTSPLRI